MPTTKVEWARYFAAKGLPVFPVVENTKRARISSWPHLATTDLAQIDAWWQEWPNDNIGFYTNEFIVIDVDPRKDGHRTHEALADIYEFPKTTRHTTQGGGHHIIYAAPDRRPVKGGTDKLGQGLDIKARGGYILLPGSTIDGREYGIGNTREIALAPAWLVEACSLARTKTDKAGKRIVEEDDKAVELATNYITNRAPTAEDGHRDNTAYKVGARVFDFGVAVPTGLELMLEWNETKCFPPMDLEDIERVTESASTNRDKAIGANHPEAPGFEAYEMPAVPNLYTDSGQAAAGMHLEGFFAAAGKALANNAEPLIKGVLDRGAMSILYGESNTGKTFIAIDLAFHIALGRPWTGRRTRQGCVVYVAAEGGRGVYKRLAALHKANPDLKDVPLFVLKFPIDLLHGPAHAKELVKLCREVAEQSGYALELIVIDTLSRAMSGGDENSSTDMGGIVKSFDAIRDVTAAHLMVIHHSGKDRAKGARGHSLLRAATDTEIEVERGRVTVTKQRDMDGEFKQAFRLKAVNIGADPDGGWVSSCVVEFIASSAAGAVVVPLTKTQLKLVTLIRRHIGSDPEKVFGWEFVSEIKARHDSDTGCGRSTMSENLKAISDAGELRKIGENQYVID